jgi:hypothetical protein
MRGDDIMNAVRTKNMSYEGIAWGVIFIWWGITELFAPLPPGTGAVGIGLILVGLNVARYMTGIPTSRFSLALGIIALVWGVLELAGAVLSLPFEIPVFPIVLIVFGAFLVMSSFAQARAAQ